MSPRKNSASSRPTGKGTFDDSEDDTPRRGFRDRTDRQMFPFLMDKMEQAHVRKGSKPTESYLEKELKRKNNSAEPKSRKRRSDSSKYSHASSRASCDRASSTIAAIDLSDVSVRTWFSELKDAHMPIPLNLKSVDALLDDIEEAWKFKLGDRHISHCVVAFPWATEKENILIMKGNHTSNGFEKMLQKVRQSPAWTDQEECAIDIEVFVN